MANYSFSMGALKSKFIQKENQNLQKRTQTFFHNNCKFSYVKMFSRFATSSRNATILRDLCIKLQKTYETSF